MGPVISAERAQDRSCNTSKPARRKAAWSPAATPAAGDGYFIRPTIIADVDSKARIFQEEIFGPVLAVTKASDFDHALRAGQRLAIRPDRRGLLEQSRASAAGARSSSIVGNLYFNRKCTGAMVGAHPFGGFNMSGTDSKAGGPDYLLLFLQAKSIAEKLR